MARSLTGTLFLSILLIGATAASAQITIDSSESLDFDRPEAWAMKYFASLSTATAMGPAERTEPGSFEIGFELGSAPSLSLEERTVGFNGTKEEDINRTSVFGRVRAAVGLAGGFTLEGSYLPPIDISGVEPNLIGLALARQITASPKWRSGLRLTAQHGTYDGDFTCSADEIANGPNEFGCEEPSRDRITMDTASLEYSLARRRDAGLEPYISAAVHLMDLDFQVRAEYRGLIDRGTLDTDGTTYSAALGLAYSNEGPLRWSAEVFYSPLDVLRPPATSSSSDALLNVRALVAYRVR